MKVSVVLLTYQHAPFIARAIESALAQRLSDDYEIVIADDASCDGTREIVVDFAKRHPDLIRTLFPEVNLGAFGNVLLLRALESARGEYVALLDGDDYWTSDEKLQRQVEFLDHHLECSLCFHNVDVVYEDSEWAPHAFHRDGPRRPFSAPIPQPFSDQADLAPGNFVQTASVMFRRAAVGPVPEWFCSLPLADWALYVMLARSGSLGYLDATWAVYRVHAGGLWSSRFSRYDKIEDVDAMLRMYRLLDQHTRGAHRAAVRPEIAQLHARAAELLAARGLTREAGARAARSWLLLAPRERLGDRRLAKILLRAYVPWAHAAARAVRARTR